VAIVRTVRLYVLPSPSDTVGSNGTVVVGTEHDVVLRALQRNVACATDSGPLTLDESDAGIRKDLDNAGDLIVSTLIDDDDFVGTRIACRERLEQ
jgi:hypothetical protein